jgi:8-oxo-dGTP diphosphatase
MEKVQKIVVGSVIENNGRFLVLKRSSKEQIFPNKWELPSGKVEFEEDPNKALIREVFEETGLQTNKCVPFKCTHYVIETQEKKRHTIQIIYLATVVNNFSIQLSEEHDEYKWISPEEIKQMNTFDDMHSILQEAEQYIKLLH